VPDPNLRIPDSLRASGRGDSSRDEFVGPPPFPSSSSSSSSSSSAGLNSEEAIRRILHSISRVVECGGTCRLGVLTSDLNDISPIKRREKKKESTIKVPDRKPPPRFHWFHESKKSGVNDIFSHLGTEDGAGVGVGVGVGAGAGAVTGNALEEEAAVCAESG
jgi:hypothetical protein